MRGTEEKKQRYRNSKSKSNCFARNTQDLKLMSNWLHQVKQAESQEPKKRHAAGSLAAPNAQRKGHLTRSSHVRLKAIILLVAGDASIVSVPLVHC
jgi:hypothetical protein